MKKKFGLLLVALLTLGLVLSACQPAAEAPPGTPEEVAEEVVVEEPEEPEPAPLRMTSGAPGQKSYSSLVVLLEAPSRQSSITAL